MARDAMTVEEAMEQAGFGRFQKRLFVICGVTWAADAAEVLMLALALPLIAEDFALGDSSRTLLVSAVFIGMLAGSLCWGPVADRIGRRRGFVVTVGIFSVFGVASVFAPSVEWLVVCRVLAGFGLGGAIPLDFSMFAEYLPRRERGRWLVLLEAWWGVGTIVVAGLAWLLLPTVGWRPLFATSAIAALLALWIRAQVPESPRWLVAAGRGDEARAVVERVAAVNGRTLDRAPLLLPPARQERARVGLLWTRDLARTTLLLWSAWFFVSLGYYGVTTWMPTVFVERGFDFVRTYAYVFLLAWAQLPGYFVAAWLVERWGRRRTLFAFLATSAVATLAFALATTPAAIVVSVAFMNFATLGAWGALYCYTPEAYPTEVRTTGMGWASGMARIAASASPVAGGILLPSSTALGIGAYAAAFAVGAMAVAVFGRETRGAPLRDTIAETQAAVGAGPRHATAGRAIA
jgi:MFS transporter, putative metabolite:H+ symporter